MKYIYAYIEEKNYIIELENDCIIKDINYILYHENNYSLKKNVLGSKLFLKNSTYKLTYNGGNMWGGTVGSSWQRNTLQYWLEYNSKVIVTLQLDSSKQLEPSALLMNISRSSSSSSKINYGPYMINYKGNVCNNPVSNLITISGTRVDISGLLFTNISGQLFNITDSSVTLSNINISGGNTGGSSSLIRYKTVNSNPNFVVGLSGPDKPTPPPPKPPTPTPTPPPPPPKPPTPKPTPSKPTPSKPTPVPLYVCTKDYQCVTSTSPGGKSLTECQKTCIKPTPPPSPAPIISKNLNLTSISINNIRYGNKTSADKSVLTGIIEINGANKLDISGLHIKDCSSKISNIYMSPLTLINTSANIINSGFINNGNDLSHSAQSITLYNSSMNILNTTFTISTNAKNYYKTIIESSMGGMVTNKLDYWNEYNKYGSIPMIRNFGVSSESSNKINIKGCVWNTSFDLSNINYLYFFVDKQKKSSRFIDSCLSITDSKRYPGFLEAIVGSLPSINVYSSRKPYKAAPSSSPDNKQILQNINYVMGDTSDNIIQALKVPVTVPHKYIHTYGLTGNYNGYKGQGIELYFANDPKSVLRAEKNGYLPANTGLLCVNSKSKDSPKDYSNNHCGRGGFLWNQDNWSIYNYPSLSKCSGRCSSGNRF